MKTWMRILMVALLALSLGACGNAGKENGSGDENGSPASSEAPSKGEENTEGARILVAYFSATGTTKTIAEQMAELLDADLYEIVPVQSYTAADLDHNDKSCRAVLEQKDDSVRPEIAGKVENMEQYDVVLLGHPIWKGEEPRILDTFVESYDWSGKTLANFCTSGGSGIREATDRLKSLAPDANWLTGRRFSGDASEAELVEWLESLKLK